jgi:hypothetical protein
VKTGVVKVLDTLIDSTERSRPRYAMTPKKSHYGTNGNMNESEASANSTLLEHLYTRSFKLIVLLVLGIDVAIFFSTGLFAGSINSWTLHVVDKRSRLKEPKKKKSFYYCYYYFKEMLEIPNLLLK